MQIIRVQCKWGWSQEAGSAGGGSPALSHDETVVCSGVHLGCTGEMSKKLGEQRAVLGSVEEAWREKSSA
jgi:hypothetical protein